MFYKNEPDAKVMSVLEKWYEVFPGDIIAYDAVRDNSITIANIYRMLYLKQHYDKEKGLEPQLTEEQKRILEERIYEIAGSIVKAQYEYIRWYNTMSSIHRSDMMTYTRTSILREAWMIMGNAPVDDIDSDKIASEIAKSIHKECEVLKNSNTSILENTRNVDTKLQMINSLNLFFKEIAKSEELEKSIASSIEHVAKFEDKKLKRYNVSRLNDSQKQEILSILRLIATLGDMANKLGGKNESTKALVNNIYNSNVEKFASHVLN